MGVDGLGMSEKEDLEKLVAYYKEVIEGNEEEIKRLNWVVEWKDVSIDGLKEALRIEREARNKDLQKIKKIMDEDLKNFDTRTAGMFVLKWIFYASVPISLIAFSIGYYFGTH